ncbi:MAG: nuclear transport factor 2 family protein [Actinomycetota bacterium]
MEQNETTIRNFYAAFQARDGNGMAACYHPEVQFSDPVFTDLKGPRAGAMWKMLCEGGSDLSIELGDVATDGSNGSAHWEARYTFTTGRKVHNRIDASFEFMDDKIIVHRDSFDLHSWASQALGLPGRLFGGLPFLQNKIRATAMNRLDKYISR